MALPCSLQDTTQLCTALHHEGGAAGGAGEEGEGGGGAALHQRVSVPWHLVVDCGKETMDMTTMVVRTKNLTTVAHF